MTQIEPVVEDPKSAIAVPPEAIIEVTVKEATPIGLDLDPVDTYPEPDSVPAVSAATYA